MPNKRSPNCPAHALGEAIEKTRAIYAAEGRNSFSGQVAVARMGYNGLNGASRRALGAVRGFGLLEGRGRELRISDDAVLIIADTDAEDQRDRQAALLRALRHNRVFADLHERFAGVGAVHEISRYLQKRYYFKPGAADHTAQIYRRSVVLLENRPAAGTPGNGDTGGGPARERRKTAGDTMSTGHDNSAPGHVDMAGETGHRAPVVVDDAVSVGSVSADTSAAGAPKWAAATRPMAGAGLTGGQLSLKLPGNRQDSFTLEQGTALLSWPEQMSPEEFEDFTDWLLLEHRKIARSVGGAARLLLSRRDRNNSG